MNVEIKKGGPLGIILGAGVSVEQGSMKWDDLLINLKNLAEKKNLVDDVDKLVKIVGVKIIWIDDFSEIAAILNGL